MSTPRLVRARDDGGFTLVEVLVAMTVLVVGVLATVTIVDAAARANSATRQRDAGVNLARDLIEAARSVPYERLTDTGVAGELQRVPGLEDRSGLGYDIERGGVDYAVAVDVCVMDDPADGGGPRSSTTTFCANSALPGTHDRNPEDYKRVAATVTWRQNGSATQSVVQTGIVGNPGSASGPAIRSIAPRGYPSPFVVTDPTVTSLMIDVTTSSRPAAINWLLDGTVQQPAPAINGSSGLAWAFSWNVGAVDTGVLDGDYIVSAEAFNLYGVSGPGRQETVILNRRRPFKPRQVTGGRTNFGTVEIEWTANAERDIAGYEVYREGSSTPVCPVARQKLDTLCVDRDPPSGSTLKYWVYAYDSDPVSGAARIGDQSDILTVVDNDQAPYPPGDLTSSRAADGSVTLSWRRPSPEDRDPGDGIEFYRVYRDGQALGDRYARWFDSSSIVRWQDTATGGTTHSYWVTAVDEHYAESPYLGPVSA